MIHLAKSRGFIGNSWESPFQRISSESVKNYEIMFAIKFNTGVPIYRQVVEQVTRQIERGQIDEGELLPSVRQLAAELGVNPMTISKAYSQLETDGVVDRKRGVGMVVIQRAMKPKNLLKPTIKQLIEDAQQMGLSKTELVKLVREAWDK